VLSASYKKKIDSYVMKNPKRSAMDDCGKAVPIARGRHALALEKGEIFTKLYTEGKTKYEEAKSIAVKVQGLCTKKTAESQDLVDEYAAKLASASGADKTKDPLSGLSQAMQWEDARENEKAEVVFYDMISKNAKEVAVLADKGLLNVKSLKAEVEKDKDMQKYHVKLNALIDDAKLVHKDAQSLWKQWEDSSKDYSCGAPPAVNHAESQCTDGNTKYSPKCAITCAVGYDGNGTKNELRCNRQGKFGKQLYGEWQGMASCVGRMCGKPPKIEKAKTVIQDIRYPHKASYVCYEGFSINRNATGPKAFDVPCDATGSFDQNTSHVCQAISCGSAPARKHTVLIEGDFKYTEVAEYKCKEGYTIDGTPGGLQGFSRTCQATGKFTDGNDCQPIRCGPPPDFDNTKQDPPTKEDQYFGDALHYMCEPGHSLDQKPDGPDHLTLSCQVDGNFGVKDQTEVAAIPKCRPVSAGMAPKIAHGSLNPHEMFYGESVVVSANTGYSATGDATTGLSFTLSVTTEGTFSGEEKFIPVVCGKAPSVEHAQTSFTGEKVVYPDLLGYECEKGYSTDSTSASASASFSVQCEPDGSLSKVPGLGKCVNVDDCDDHTCGPHGTCVDHLMNYTCDCSKGYEQTYDNATDELVCGNINDCGPEACGIGDCIDGVDDYKCQCPTGYEQVDEESTSNPGKFDHTCKAVMCGVPPEIENAATTPVEVGSEKAYYPTKVVYQCDLGYTTDGTATGKNHFDIDCLETKAFTDTKSCQPIKCDSVPKVEFATPKATAATFNESVRFDCDKGHTVDGTADGDHGFTVTCQVTGTFGEPQACKPISCGAPDDIPNAFRASGSLVYEQSVTYTCLEGFTEDGSKEGETEFSITCQEDGKLTKLKQCLPKICGEPPAEIHALYASTKDEGMVSYPMNTEVMCRDGYTIGGEPSGQTTFLVKCLQTGEFAKYDERNCQPVMCGAPPAMPNATMIKIKTPDPSKPGLTRKIFYVPMAEAFPDLSKKAPAQTDTVANINQDTTSEMWPQLSHKDNFAVRYSGALMIKKDGKYSFQLQSDDGSLLYVNGQLIIDNDGLHGFDAKTGSVELAEGPQAMTVDYFQKAGGAGVVLRWKGPDAGDGGDWQVVPEESLQTKGGNLNYEEKAVYECLPGFTTGGEFDAPTTYNVECLPNGQLSAPSADMQCRNVNDCEQHTCGPKGQCIDLVGPAPAYTCECDHGYEIQTSANGEKRCGNKDDCQGKDCGVGVCKDLIGDYTCTCPSGYYIGTKDGQKTCVAVTCSDDTPVLVHGKMFSTHSGSVSFPTTLRYHCDTGYSVDGSVSESKRDFQAQCKSDGQLFGMMSCQKITCGTPHVLPFTKLLEPATPRRSIEYEDEAKYECIEGYTLGGKVDGKATFSVKCQDDGVLTDPEVCEPVNCGIAPRMDKSRPGLAGDVFFGQQLMYKCDAGYALDSLPQSSNIQYQRHCLKDGTFSALQEEQPCKPVAAGVAPSIGHATMKEYAGLPVIYGGSGEELEGEMGDFPEGEFDGGLDLHGKRNRLHKRSRKGFQKHAAGEVQFPPEVTFPHGVEYRCDPGYSVNGAASGPTKVTARANSIGSYTPALPSECKLISYKVSARVQNARNGYSLSGVTVTVEGTDNSVTSNWGFFTLRNVPAGQVTLVYRKNGYITTKRELTVTGNVNSGGVGDISMSPAMESDQWRAVVKWGRRPSDLDTYAKWGWSKVCWYGTRQRSNRMTGTLEVDRTSGYGPETLYLTGVGNCRGGSYYCDIKYIINDYTRSGSMLRLGDAEVTAYTGSRVAGTWKITQCPQSVSSDGNWWHVFTLDGRTNRLKWNCASGSLLQTNATASTGSISFEKAFSFAANEKPRLKIRSLSK
jgi:hypothetical protein